MSISCGAFGQSRMRAFIQSPMGNARGWPARGVFVMGRNGTLYSIDPADGEILWTLACDRYTRLAITEGRLVLQRQATSVRRIDRKSGGVLQTSLALAAAANLASGLAAAGDSVLTVTTVTGNPVVVKLSEDMSAIDWSYAFEHGADDSLSSPSVDADGNSYWRNQVLLDNDFPSSTADANLYKLDAAGNQAWKRNYGTDLGLRAVEAFRTAIAPDALYMHIVTGSIFATDYRLLKVSKDTGAIIDSVLTRFVSSSVTATARILRHRNGDVYMCDSTGVANELLRFDTTTMTEADAITTGNPGITSLAEVNDGSGDIIAVGFRSTTWTGAGGNQANITRLDENLNVLWVKDLTGTAVDLYDVAAGYLPV